jgi:hypothetical protein
VLNESNRQYERMQTEVCEGSRSDVAILTLGCGFQNTRPKPAGRKIQAHTVVRDRETCRATSAIDPVESPCIHERRMAPGRRPNRTLFQAIIGVRSRRAATDGKKKMGTQLNIDHGDVDDRYGTDAATRAEEKAGSRHCSVRTTIGRMAGTCYKPSRLVRGSGRLGETLLATCDQLQSVLIPPSITNSLPTVKAASSDARKTIALAISAGSPNLRAGICCVRSRAALLFLAMPSLS